MNHIQSKIARQILYALIVLALPMGLMAQATQIESIKMTVNGTSTLHDWTSDATNVRVSMDADMNKPATERISRAYVQVPVKGIKSSKGSTMDGKTWDALKYKKHPEVTFAFERLTSWNANGALTAVGKLTIAGKTRTETIQANVKSVGNGSYLLSGSKTIKMTDFGMDPPTALLGTIKTGDEVTIKFDIRYKVK